MLTVLYPLLAVLDIAFTILCVVAINWWAPLFATPDARLPWWLAWVDTFDDTLDAGVRDLCWKPGYWSRVRWLYRNPGYGFGYWLLGCEFEPEEWEIEEATVDMSVPWAPLPLRFVADGPGQRFNIMGVVWKFQYKFGWKAWNYYDPQARTWKKESWGPQMRAPFVFSIKLARGDRM